jgi:hypothetical protein
MKMISCNNWAPRNRKYHLWPYCYYYENMGIEVYIPELNKLHVTINVFYHRLAYMLYNVLDEDGYLNEDN